MGESMKKYSSYRNMSTENLKREIDRLEREAARVRMILRERELGGGRQGR